MPQDEYKGVRLPSDLVLAIEEQIKQSGKGYKSVSEFVKEAIREKLYGPGISEIAIEEYIRLLLETVNYQYSQEVNIGRGLAGGNVIPTFIIDNNIIIQIQYHPLGFRTAVNIGSIIFSMKNSGKYKKLHIVATNLNGYETVKSYFLDGNYKRIMGLVGSEYPDLVDIIQIEDFLKLIVNKSL